MNREQFIKNSFSYLKGKLLENLTSNEVKNQIKNVPLRPLGAVQESIFLEKCDSCGKCVEACPDSVIKMVEDFDKIIRPRLLSLARCFSCSEKNCHSVCEPHILTQTDRISPAKISLNKENCISYLGSFCRICFDNCPEKRKAIILENLKPVIIAEKCTGCEECFNFCISDPKAIEFSAWEKKG
jgi:ferredoxin